MTGGTPAVDAGLLDVPLLAEALRAGRVSGWSTADLLRLVRQLRSDFARLGSDGARLRFLRAPATTGDARWDAMVAGNAEELALRAHLTVPAWTRGPALPTFWFVGSGEAMRAYTFARSPFSLQVRGVMVDPADLESV